MRSTLAFYCCITGANLLDAILGNYIAMFAAASGASPAVVGFISAASIAPWLCSPILGVYLDRLGAYRVFIAVTFFRPAALGAMAVCSWIPSPQPWVLLLWIALATMNGAVDMGTDISAQTYLGQNIPPTHLAQSYGVLGSIQIMCASLFAPAVVGLLVNFPFSWVVSVAAGCALLTALPTIKMKQESSTAHQTTSSLKLRGGLKILWRNSWLRRAALSVSILNIMNSAAGAVGMVYLLQQLQANPAHLGLAWSLMGATSVVGGYLAGRITNTIGFSSAVILGAVSLILSDAALFITSSLPLLAALWALSSFFTPLFGINIITQRQRITHASALGRVNAAFQFLGIGAAPIGSMVGGLCASAWGVWPVLLVALVVSSVTLFSAKPWCL